MSKPRTPSIGITGANGFIGSEMVKHFNDAGFKVIAYVRAFPRVQVSGVKYVLYALDQPVKPGDLRGLDYLVHAAYVKASDAPDAYQLNVAGTKRLIESAKRANVTKLLFLSSMSAKQTSTSTYGKQKRDIEELFNTTQDLIVRPGLVLGDGGLVRDMVGFMRSKHIVPLIGGGKQPIQIISVEELIQGIHNLLESEAGIFTLASNNIYQYDTFYKQLAQAFSVKVLFVPLPYWLVYSLLKTAQSIGLSGRVGTDNLEGLRQLSSIKTEADLRRADLVIEPLPVTLTKLVDRMV